jgi:hypothetical protein
MYGVKTDESAMGIGLETMASPLAIVSWNSGVPVMVRTPPPMEISGNTPRMPVRNPSRSAHLTSAPPAMIEVCTM